MSYISKKSKFKKKVILGKAWYECQKCGDLVTKEHRELHELSRHTY